MTSYVISQAELEKVKALVEEMKCSVPVSTRKICSLVGWDPTKDVARAAQALKAIGLVCREGHWYFVEEVSNG